mmetsp:Transcript_13533/g.28951  ORF Transcript_13533/g.28951 Transcript_13533/m.28951 type:complete len:377 (+) Transcript_13533:170-1300(+)
MWRTSIHRPSKTGAVDNLHSLDSAEQSSSSAGPSQDNAQRTARNGSYALPLASLTQATAAKADPAVSRSATAPQPAPSAPAEKPAHDVLAGAMARAASQSTIHPIDTLKVRMQAGKPAKGPSPNAGSARNIRVHAAGVQTAGFNWPRVLSEVGSLYKGVLGAATGAGIIIGAYFAFYSTTKQYLRKNTAMKEGSVAFVAGATAAVGSSVVKVPIAVCIRSVQAGVYKNAFHAAKSITSAAGVQGLFTGFLPTLLEDAPDMAVKFAVYESMRALHRNLHGGNQPSTLEDLFMGGLAGAAAAAATTPVDVVKTRMMGQHATAPLYTSSLDCLIKSVRAEGVMALYKGFLPTWMRLGPWQLVFWVSYEQLRKAAGLGGF